MEKSNIIAGAILLALFLLSLGSIWNDSATMDEQAHIPAGFGYVTQLDYRLNPEHPPLLKTMSALSAWIAVRPHFPTDTPYWRDDINGQWAQGVAFLFESGNDADSIIFWSRIPFVLLTVLFGWLFYNWTKNRYGGKTALIALALFAFSPTVLAHSGYVTTDMGAAFGFFIGIAGFIMFLESPTWRNVFLAGIIFGIAQLLKFSLVLLIPVYGLILLGWVWAIPRLHFHERIRVFFRTAGKTFAIGAIGLLLVWAVYVPHVWNYPAERQLRDTEAYLAAYGFRPMVEVNLALIRNEITRPFAQYLLGILMVDQRQAGGNTAFFLGEVSNRGSSLYFPLLYVVKEPLPLHILTLVALLYAFRKYRRSGKEEPAGHYARLRSWVNGNLAEFSALVFIFFYWALSVYSPLNIGIRHVLPTFPFIFVLVAKAVTGWLHEHRVSNPQTWLIWLKDVYRYYVTAISRHALAAVLLIWLVAGTILEFPHYLPYYNELVGTRDGWRVAVDSNYDWGQDLIRLADYAKRHNIEKIAVDYFGGASPRYYLGSRFEPWWSARGPAEGWFAISATFRQGAFGTTVPGFLRPDEESYEWLKPYEPVGRIGYSIFLYKLPNSRQSDDHEEILDLR